MAQPLIKLQDVSVQYNSRTSKIKAVRDVSFDIEAGEFVCLLGPSGCGKSTILKLIAGYLQPTQGSVTMRGETIVGPDRHRGVVFQHSTLYPWMNVRHNVEFGPRMQGLGADQLRKLSDHYLDQVKLSSYADKKTYELSGGMKQRVALARVLANEPEVILMDEPLGELDALTRIQMQALLRGLWQKNNTTMFMITHDIDEALSLGTKVMVMSSSPGTIVKSFQPQFTHCVGDNAFGRVDITPEYISLRDEIFGIITLGTDL
ncbi:MAG: ABC transporter ATP-binding protein [Eubacteriales bacterium]|nr:ABC transporter ATP-binding protein [Eubacteriales bacterium]